MDVTLAARPLRCLPRPQRMLFADCARSAIAARQAQWRNAKHRAQWLSTLQTYAFPVLGGMDVAAIEVAHVWQVLQPIWLDKAETAARLRGRVEAVLDYASARGWRSAPNAARWKGLLDKLLPAPKKLARMRPLPRFARCSNAGADAAPGRCAGSCGAGFAAVDVDGSACGRGARRALGEFDMDAALWVIPAQRMNEGGRARAPRAFEQAGAGAAARAGGLAVPRAKRVSPHFGYGDDAGAACQ